MALTDFWQLKDNQVYDGKSVLNVYHLKRILVTANAQDVIDAFVNSVLTFDFLAAQSIEISRTTIECENLGDPTDFASFNSAGLPGTDLGAFPSTFTAASIQFNRTRTDMKNGQKRFAMGTEADISNGVWIAAFVAGLQTFGDNIVTAWVTAAAPLVDVCEYAILKRFCVVPAQDPCVKYRLPVNDAEIDAFHYVPSQALVRTQARSQVSRKIL